MSACLRFLNENFIDSDVLANQFASSEATGFLKENALDGQRRTKLWRTGGYWNIVAGSNTIVFEETATVNLTATIAVAAYTSTATFLAAIKTAFEAVGGSVYTITVDATTGKINIASDGAGGGGILNLEWTNGSSTAMAGILGYSTAADDTGALTYLADLLRISTEEFLEFDLGMASQPRAFALVSKRNSAINISPGATITLEGNETNAWASPSFTQTITYNSEIMFFTNTLGFHTEALRFWRLSVSDIDNPLGFFDVGYIYLGEYYNTTQGGAQFPFQNAQEDLSNIVVSEGGQIFTDVRSFTERFNLNMRFLSIAEKEEIERTWEKFGRETPLFISMDTDANFGSDANQYFKLVYIEDKPAFILEAASFWATQLRLREAL